MEDLTEFILPFVGLKDGQHTFDFDIDTTFFNAFEFSDFSHAAVKVKLLFDKKPSLMNLSFTAQGVVGLACDVSNEIFDFELDSKLDWIVKFGDEYDDDHDEFLIHQQSAIHQHLLKKTYM